MRAGWPHNHKKRGWELSVTPPLTLRINYFCLFAMSWFKVLWKSAEVTEGFPSGSGGKESACNVGDLGSIPGLGRSSGEGHGNPLQYSCLENPNGQRSLVGHSPWGCKEPDMTEWLKHSTEITQSVVVLTLRWLLTLDSSLWFSFTIFCYLYRKDIYFSIYFIEKYILLV